MDFVFIKVMLWINAYLLFRGSPLAMLRHATSSQSIIFRQAQVDQRPPTTTTSSPHYTGSQTQPNYEYKYEVSDHETGDRKSHWESREGDQVRGSYTLYEPDGVLRTVEYSADAVHGFNAVVKRNEPNKHQLRTANSSFKERLSSNSISESVDASDGHYKYLPKGKGLTEGRGGSDHGRYSGLNDKTEVGFRVDHTVGLHKLAKRSFRTIFKETN